MKKAGRPTKKNARKSGELQSHLCRFSFIAEKKQVETIKLWTQALDISIKDFMRKIISRSIPTDAQLKAYIRSQEIKPKRRNFRLNHLAYVKDSKE